MPSSLSCLGCKSTKFTTQRGLAKHRSECIPFKRLQKKKITKLVLPEEEEHPLPGDLGFEDVGDVEDVNMEQNIDELEVVFSYFLYSFTGIHNS
jgi:hypothetical protein